MSEAGVAARRLFSRVVGGLAEYMATSTGDNEFNLRKIARWLRGYLDWKAELSAEPGIPSVTDFSRPSVQGGNTWSGALIRGAVRDEELESRVATIDSWLTSLTYAERLAADYWLQDQDGTITEVAQATGLHFRQAKLLTQAIPLIIWSRFYANRNAS